MKAVLLAAGKGSRLKPITDEVAKPMITIASKPILEYVVRDLVRNNYDELCIVIGYHGSQIRDYFGNGNEFGAKIEYVIQTEYRGTADALRYSKTFVGNGSFLLYLSDTVIPNLSSHLNHLGDDSSEVNILSAELSQKEIVNAGSIEVEGERVTKLAEKSPTPRTNLAWAGLARFKSNHIFSVIDTLAPSWRGYSFRDP